MKCSYHPTVDFQDACSVCSKPLCAECSHKIKGKPYCQDCLVQGAEWAATVKGLKIPSDSPKRAALCAIIPGMGAVYNNEYTKAITYFAVFAVLGVMSDRMHEIFGFGAFVFWVFTLFDAYRTAEAKARTRLQSGVADEPLQQDRTIIAWGIVLIILGTIFLLQNVIPYYFLNRLWPLVFVLLGAFLVYRAVKHREKQAHDSGATLPRQKEEI